MIPKKIHYCWFGGEPLPELAQKCIESWHEFCPDYEIIQWNENNFDINSCEYIKEAYKAKKWAFVSDYVRLDVVYNYGGIYLDTDVELIKPLTSLLKLKGFFGVESYDLSIATGLGFGGEQYNDVIKELRDFYNNIKFYNDDGSLNLIPCPIYTTEYFEKLGYKKNNSTQIIRGINIFSSDIFCPYDFKDGSMNMQDDTISIHWYNASWLDEDSKKIHDMEVKIHKRIRGKMGRIISYMYRKVFRLRMAIKRGETIKLFVKKTKQYIKIKY